MKYKELDFNELEELSVVGGMDDRGDVEVNSPITVSLVTKATVAVSTLSIAWSGLYSCTKNKVTCNR